MTDEPVLETDLAVDLSRKLAEVLKGNNAEVCEKALALCVALHISAFGKDIQDKAEKRRVRVQVLMLFTSMVSKLVPIVEHTSRKVN